MLTLQTSTTHDMLTLHARQYNPQHADLAHNAVHLKDVLTLHAMQYNPKHAGFAHNAVQPKTSWICTLCSTSQNMLTWHNIQKITYYADLAHCSVQNQTMLTWHIICTKYRIMLTIPCKDDLFTTRNVFKVHDTHWQRVAMRRFIQNAERIGMQLQNGKSFFYSLDIH